MLTRKPVQVDSHDLNKYGDLLKSSSEALADFRDQVYRFDDFPRLLKVLRHNVLENKALEEVGGIIVQFYKRHPEISYMDLTRLIDPILQPLYEVFESYQNRIRVFDTMMDYYRYEANRRKQVRIVEKAHADAIEENSDDGDLSDEE